MDWGEAFRVAGIGFGGVVLILIILAVALWLAGIRFYRAAQKGNGQGKEKHGPRSGGGTDTGQDT
jgi:Na+-transporting methylmalonyl-CoA/oxaloacetate decarboxylase gamma subunit